MKRIAFLLPFLLLQAAACDDDRPTGPAPALAAAFTVGGTLQAGQPVRFDAAASVNPGGGGLSYTWAFGDGAHGGTREIAHLYAQGGAFAVQLTVRDAQDRTASATQTVTIAPGPAATGTAALSGLVSTIAGAPLSGVTVVVAGSTVSAQTAADGTVTLAGVPAGVPVVLRLTRAAHADGFVRLDGLAAGSTDGYFQAALKPRGTVVTLANAENGGTVAGAAGAQLVVPAGGLVHADGSAVTGAVDVTFTPVDVSAEIGAFPGAFTGIESGGTRSSIATYGVMEVTLTRGGQPLRLAPGRAATLEIPITTGGAAAGQSIPLWSLDEASGLWVQEGTGTVVASAGSPTALALRGTVAHLSWWNIDVPFNPFTINVQCFTATMVPATEPCWVWAEQQGPGARNSPAEGIPPGVRTSLPIPPGISTRIHGATPTGAIGDILVNGVAGTSQNVDIVLTSGTPLGTVVLVAAGGNGPAVAVSDGVSWHTPATPLGYASTVAWNGSLWLAGGPGVMTSPDGLTWTAAPSASAIFNSVNAVAWNGLLWVAVGDNNLGFALATSPDGQAWTQRTVPSIPQRGEAVAWNGQAWLVGGNQFGGVLRSTDGISWTLIPGPVSSVLALAAGGLGEWVALGYDASGAEITGLSSNDGSNWTTYPLAMMVPMSLAYNGSTWLGGGSTGVLISTDGGINWLSWYTGISAGGLAWNGTMWVSVGTDGNGDGYVVTSSDAINWSTPMPLPNDGRDIAYRRTLYPPWP